MKISYFKQSTGFIAVTDDCPPGFKGVLFIGKGGLTPQSVSEQVYSPADVKGLTAVPKAAMPDEWLLALGYEKPAPKPKPAPPPPAPVEWPVFDEAGEELLDLVPVRNSWPRPRHVASTPRCTDFWTVVGWIIGAALVGIFLYLSNS